MAHVDDLRQIFRDKPTRVVLIVGTGVPAGALRGGPRSHLTTWDGLLRSGLQRIHELQKISADELASYEGILTRGNLKAWLTVAGRIEDELGAPAHGEFRRWLRETVGTFEEHVTDRGVLEALAAHQRRGALLATTNYDLLLEDATDLHSVTWRHPGGVERALRGHEPQVLHLHGAWRWPDSIVLGVKSYTDVARDAHAQFVLTALRTGRTFVFVGCGAGLCDPNLGAFLRSTANVFRSSEYRHYRLCLNAEVAALEAEHFDEQCILPLPYGATHAELAPFLRFLLPADVESLRALRGGVGRGEPAPPDRPGWLSATRGAPLSTEPAAEVFLNVWFPASEPREPRLVVGQAVQMCVDLGPRRPGSGPRARPLGAEVIAQLREVPRIDVWVQCPDADVTPCEGTLDLRTPGSALSFVLTPHCAGGLRVVVVLLLRNQPIHRVERELQVWEPDVRAMRW